MVDEAGEIKVPRNVPLVLTDRQKRLCRHLDALNRIENFCPNASPSELFRSALYLTQTSNKVLNPDWMAQAAHSLREIMYNIGSIKKSTDDRNQHRRNQIGKVLEVWQKEARAAELARILNNFHNIFTNIAHHSHETQSRKDTKKKLKELGFTVVVSGRLITDAIFEQLIDSLEKAWSESFPRQLTIHEKIDSLLLVEPESIDRRYLGMLLTSNPDARQYFFSKTDERWLDWLWGNGLLNAIKGKVEDVERVGYRIPELDYFARIAEKVPQEVVDIMLKASIISETTDLAVVDRFLWVCKKLPADQLARMVGKIRDEKWIPLMGESNRWFGHEKMFRVLSDVGDYKSVLILAEAILEVRTINEMDNDPSEVKKDNPFYFSDLSNTQVFKHLASLEGKYAEVALALAVKTMKKIVLLNVRAGEEGEFIRKERFKFYAVDFFNLEFGKYRRSSYRDDVVELAALIKVLVKKMLGKSPKTDSALKLYREYVNSLPESVAMWRLRLFVLGLYPNIFKDEFKVAYFKIFESDDYRSIMDGAEYKKSLKKGFPELADSDKREYVAKVIGHFSRSENIDRQEWDIHQGSQILSMIWDQLKQKERQEAKNAGYEREADYKPTPSISQVSSGWLHSRGPISSEEFNRFSINEIAEKLQKEWSPEKMKGLDTDKDRLCPVNAEGVAGLLKTDIPKRLREYVDNAGRFFERNVLDPHYTHAYFNGLREALRENKSTSDINWEELISTFVNIKESAESESFERGERTRDSFAWLVGWDSVHSALSDVVRELFIEKDGAVRIDFPRFRDRLFGIIGYILNYPDPVPENEKVDHAKIKSRSSGGSDYLVSDPLTTAISSVRGRAFETFVDFIYQDGKGFAKEDKVKIANDVKKLYRDVLSKENTRALMFMFGHYLPSFYFWDREWIKGLLSEIFPAENDKKYLYLAAWEGYLAASLYGEMFFDPHFQELYERGLALTGTEDPGREYYKKPDEGIAIHLALAFVHFDGFGFGHPLYENFWKNNSIERHAAFIGFIGRNFISGEDAGDNELLEKKPEIKRRFEEFWDWLLENYERPEPFIQFGHWITPKKPVFEPHRLAGLIRKTLEKTKGVLDWDYGLTKTIQRLAQEAPEDALAIARLFSLEGGVRGAKGRGAFYLVKEWREALQVLYANPSTKSGTCDLIDELIREGGSVFWELKEILS